MLKTIEMIEIEGKNYEVINFNEIDQEKYHGFIYVTVNKLDGKKYVGKKSWSGKDPETYLGSGRHFKNAVNRYGGENFVRYIIDLAQAKDELNEKEEFYINEEFNATVVGNDWYNISKTATGGDTSAGRTEEEKKETRKKKSEAMKNVWLDPEYKKKNREMNKGRKYKTKAVIIFKNNQYFNTFSSTTSAANALEKTVGGYLRKGIADMVNKGWVPKSGQLKSYSAMYLSDYEKLQENQLQKIS